MVIKASLGWYKKLYFSMPSFRDNTRLNITLSTLRMVQSLDTRVFVEVFLSVYSIFIYVDGCLSRVSYRCLSFFLGQTHSGSILLISRYFYSICLYFRLSVCQRIAGGRPGEAFTSGRCIQGKNTWGSEGTGHHGKCHSTSGGDKV